MRTLGRSLLFLLVISLSGSLLLTESLQAGAAQNKRISRKAKNSSAKTKKYDTFTLALMHYHGKLVKRDEVEAARLLGVAADRGDARAMFYLGTFYYSGLGVAMDRRKAVYWIRRAAGKDHAQAQYAYGLLLLSGDGVPVDKVRAMEWLGKAANNGNKSAAVTLRELVALKRSPLDELATHTGPYPVMDAPIPDVGGGPRFAGRGVILDQGAFSLKFSLPDLDDARAPISLRTEEGFWNRLQGGKFEIIFPLEK